MRNLTGNNSGRFRKTMTVGLIPLLLLAILPGCVARHMPDWSRVQDMKPDTETHVRLYDRGASDPVKGRFLSATDNSLTLKSDDGQSETFQRQDIREILRYREWGQRWPGWLAFGIAVAVGGNAFRAEADFTPGAQVLFGVAIPVGIAIPFFFGSKMQGIYEIHPEHRDWHPQGTSSATVAPSPLLGATPPASNHDEAVTKSR